MLNEKQIEAVDRIYDFMTEENGGEYLLKGPAGSGKTFTVKYIMKKIENYTMDTDPFSDFKICDIGDDNYDLFDNDADNDYETEVEKKILDKDLITFCAPTHKALKVLKKSIMKHKSRKLKFSFITTSKMLHKKKDVYVEDGVIKDIFISEHVDKTTGKIIRNEIEYKNIEIAWKNLSIKKKEKIDFEEYLEKFIYDREKKIYFTTPFGGSIVKNGIYIIDECSMIGNSDYGLMKELVEIYNLKILYIGDSAQLAPIVPRKPGEINEMKLSRTFKIKDKSILHKTERTSSKDLYRIYSKFRNIVYDPSINYKEHIYQYLNKNTNYLTVLNNKKKFLNHIIKSISNQENVCVLSHTNKIVAQYNAKIKKKICPNSTEDWDVGDRIIFNKPYKSSNALCDGNQSIRHYPCKFINNNDTGYITAVRKFIHEDKTNYFGLCKTETGRDKKPITVYELDISIDDYGCPLGNENIELTVYKVAKEDRDKYLSGLRWRKKEIVNKIENKKMTKKEQNKILEFLNYKKNELDTPIKRSYALTTSKSQGSTYDKIFIDTCDLDWCRMSKVEKAHNLYTAVTRASCKIFMLVKFGKDDKKSSMLDEDFLRKCSRCHSKKILKEFVRSNGNVKKTCNNCSLSQKRIRKEKQNNIKN